MNNEPVDYPPLKAGGIIENNEPVAFWNKDFDLWEENAIQTYKADGWNIPLYTHPVKTSDWNCDDVNIDNLEKDIKQFCKDNFRLAPFFVMLYHALNIHPEKTLTENITEIKRTSDQSIAIVFTSCRSASEFETILRKAQEK